MKEAVEYLYSLRRFGKQTGRERAYMALEMINHPEKDLKIVHVAGTNGKGSVCAYISNCLIKTGFNVGLFTSPHLIRVNERIKINNHEISDDDFLYYFYKTKEISEKMKDNGDDGLAFFDFVCVMSLMYFADMKVDYVILETGMGGKSDATSAILPSSKILSVITSISLDHVEILGDTLEKIAMEKSGIICNGVPVVYLDKDDSVSRIIEDCARKCNSVTYPVEEKRVEILGNDRNTVDFCFDNDYYRNSVFKTKTPGLYQAVNASLALVATAIILKYDKRIGHTDRGMLNDELPVIEGIASTVWEGRMQEIKKNIFIDGAHNPDGIDKFIDTAVKMREGDSSEAKYILLFSAVCEKDYESMIKKIINCNVFDIIVVTKLDNHRALDSSIIFDTFKKYTDKIVILEPEVKKALDRAQSFLGNNDVMFAAGSLYLVGILKELLGE